MKTFKSVICLVLMALSMSLMGRTSTAEEIDGYEVVIEGASCQELFAAEYGWIATNTVKPWSSTTVYEEPYEELKYCPAGRPCSCFPPNEPHPHNEENRLVSGETINSVEHSISVEESTGTGQEAGVSYNVSFGAGIEGGGGATISESTSQSVAIGQSTTVVFPELGPVKCGERIKWNLKIVKREQKMIRLLEQAYCSSTMGFNAEWKIQPNGAVKNHSKVLNTRFSMRMVKTGNLGCP